MILLCCCCAFLLADIILWWPARHRRSRWWWSGIISAPLAMAGIGFALATDIVAQKAFALMLMPTGLTWLLLITVTVGAWRQAPRALAVIASIALGSYTLAGNVWLGDALVASLERRIPPLDIATMHPFEAVFVLGGGSDLSVVDGPQFGEAGDRLALAARLWHAGKTPLLVASGSSIGELEQERDLGEETGRLWRGLAVPASAIITLPGPVNTTQEIAAYATLIRARGWTRVGLLSSAWHLPRALALARTAGLEMVPLGADRHGQVHSWSPYWLIPRSNGFENVQRACWEYLGLLKGR